MKKIIPYYPAERDEAETWFADMAAKGWKLIDTGGIFAKFEKGEPKSVRFRLDMQAFGHMTKAEEEYYELCRASGWEPVCQYGTAYVLRTEDADAGEIQSDSEIFLKELHKTENGAFAGGIFCVAYLVLVILALIFELAAGRLYPAQTLVNARLVPLVSFALMVISALALGISNLLSSQRLHRRIMDGTVLAHEHRSPKSAAVRVVMMPILIISTIGILARPIYAGNGWHATTPLTGEIASSLPFPTLVDIDPQMAAVIETRAGDTAADCAPYYELTYFYYTDSSIPAPVQYFTDQSSAACTAPDANGFSYDIDNIGLRILYYKMWSQALAKAYVSELMSMNNDYLPIENVSVSAADFDEAFGYIEGSSQYILLRSGKTVLKITYIGGDRDLTQCLDLFARKLQK